MHFFFGVQRRLFRDDLHLIEDQAAQQKPTSFCGWHMRVIINVSAGRTGDRREQLIWLCLFCNYSLTLKMTKQLKQINMNLYIFTIYNLHKNCWIKHIHKEYFKINTCFSLFQLGKTDLIIPKIPLLNKKPGSIWLWLRHAVLWVGAQSSASLVCAKTEPWRIRNENDSEKM